MMQEARRQFLIRALIDESPRHRNLAVPPDEAGQRRLLRALLNVRPPRDASAEFLAVQDAYLQAVTAEKGVTDASALLPIQDDFFLWRGDITTLKCDAIVNAANSGMTGCYQPCHGCIDNAIHTYAGVQLRLECAALMAQQGHAEPVGGAKLTRAYNLPCRYVLHTVGPIVTDRVTAALERQLCSCYRACLALADENGLKSVAFCCISTGEFHFPNERAAQLAIQTAREYKAETRSAIKVIWNVFTDRDHEIYRRLLKAD